MTQKCRWIASFDCRIQEARLTLGQVKFLKNTFVLVFVAYWALMINHCGLESIAGLEFLACSPQAESAPHAPAGCDDDNDGCATVESGLFKAEQNQFVAAKAPVFAVTLALAMLSDLACFEPTANQISSEVSPPELVRVWQFSLRTALPPRAPSLLA